MSWFMGYNHTDEYYKELAKIQKDIADKNKKCECGAEKTKNKNCHSDWCPKFEKGKFETDSKRRSSKCSD